MRERSRTFFANFVPRTRVKEAINALLSARELSFVHVGSKSLLQVTPPKQAYVPKPGRASAVERKVYRLRSGHRSTLLSSPAVRSLSLRVSSRSAAVYNAPSPR